MRLSDKANNELATIAKGYLESAGFSLPLTRPTKSKV